MCDVVCPHPPYSRAAHELWSSSIYEYQCIDVSDEAEKVARLLRQGEGECEGVLGVSVCVVRVRIKGREGREGGEGEEREEREGRQRDRLKGRLGDTSFFH